MGNHAIWGKIPQCLFLCILLPPPFPLSLSQPISSRSVSASSEKTPHYCMPSGEPRHLETIFPVSLSVYLSWVCPQGFRPCLNPPFSRNKRKFSSNQKKASFFGSIITPPKPLWLVWPIPALRNVIKKLVTPPFDPPIKPPVFGSKVSVALRRINLWKRQWHIGKNCKASAKY